MTAHINALIRRLRDVTGGFTTLAVACALVIVGSLSTVSAQAVTAEPSAAWVQSDKDDYPPGGLVHLDGGGWQPGEAVHLYVNDDQGRTWDRHSDVVADELGQIRDDFTLPDWFVATYKVLATGELSGTAATSFTDSNVQMAVAPAGTTATVTRTLYTGSTNCSSGSTTVTTGTNDIAVGNGESVRLQAAATNSVGQSFGSWSATNNAAFTDLGGRAICVSGANNNGALKFEATYISAPVAAATTLTVAPSTGTYGGTSSLSATLRKTADSTPVSGKTVTFSLGGTSVGTAVTNASGVAQLSAVSLAAYGAGTHTGAAAASFSGDTSFSSASGTAALTVAKAPLQVTADNKSKIYGDSNPGLTFSVAELVNGDTKASAFTTNPSLSTAPTGANAGTYAINVSAGVSPNYNLTYTAGTLRVDPAVLTVTAHDKTRPYGEDNPAFTYTVSGLKNGDTEATALVSSPLLTTTATSTSPTDTYPISVTGGSAAANYTLQRVAGVLTIGQRAITVTADHQAKTYGQADPELTYKITSGSLAAGDRLSGSLSRDAGEGVGTYAIRRGTLGAGPGYTITFVDGALTVNAKALLITANNQSKTYGDALDLGDSAFTTDGLVNDDTVETVTLASAGADAGAAKGSYKIVASQATGSGLGNYTISYTDGTLTVNAKALEITANNQSKTYGDALDLGDSAFTTDGLVNDDTVETVTLASAGADAGAAKGSYKIVASQAAGSGLGNYTITYSDGTLTVNAKALEITANNQSKTYGDALDLGDSAFTTDGLVNDDTVETVTLASAGADAGAAKGSYKIVASQATGSGLGNYTITYTDGTLTVNAKALEITANNQSKTYGDALDLGDSAFTTDGLVNDDTVETVTLASAGADAGAAKGSYKIVASQATGSGLGNYTISYTDGTLTVNAKALEITANNQSKTYGDALDLGDSAFTTDGLVNDDTVETVTLASAGADAGAAKGSYKIVASQAAGSGLGNYTITYSDGTLTVDAKALLITANNQSKTYGDANPTLDGSISGIKNGDAISASYSTTATVASSVGQYAILAQAIGEAGVLSNYDVTLNPAILTVTKAPLTVKADDKTKILGAANPTLTGVVSGIRNEDAVTGSYATGATAVSPVGPYPITATATGAPAVLANYAITETSGTLKIVFGWDGFLQPINDTAHQVGAAESKFKLGQTIPVKFDLKNAAGQLVQQSSNPTFSRTDYLGVCDNNTSLETVATVSPDGGAAYTYTGGHYQYNWSTKSVSKAGEYRIFANLADGTSQSVYICLTK